jgi:transcriptional regulator with XRE-family HTH domain
MTDGEAEKIIAKIAALLRARREEMGLSMNELASRAGLDQVAVSRIEKGERSPRVHTILKLAAALQIRASAIFAESEE